MTVPRVHFADPVDAALIAAASVRAKRNRDSEAARKELRGANLEAQTRTDTELVVGGPAGTGKSVALLYKLHTLAERYPRFRGLMLRKTRASLTQSAMVTFEEKVVPPSHPALFGVNGQRLARASRSEYAYPNGSVIATGGMDDARRLLSTEYDVIYVQEITELQLEEATQLLRALRNNRMPYQQLMADCNPQAPTHWVKERAAAGELTLLESRHEDNPALHDGKDWTPFGLEYIARLDRLPGVLRDRLRLGLWRQAEGTVYDFDPRVHVYRSEIPPSWRAFAAIDFGFTNPFVWQLWRMDPDGRLYLQREIYRTQRLNSDHAEDIKRELERVGAAPETTVADSEDPEGRATLAKLGIANVGASKGKGSVLAGIQAVQARLRKADDGRPRLYVCADALVERDEALAGAHRPTSILGEMDTYVWAKDAQGRAVKEEPAKENDHACDAMRYLVAHVDRVGQQPAAWGYLQLAAQAARERERRSA